MESKSDNESASDLHKKLPKKALKSCKFRSLMNNEQKNESIISDNNVDRRWKVNKIDSYLKLNDLK